MRRRLLANSDKQPGRIISEPEVLSLTYNGNNLNLITPGIGTGVMMYSLDDSSFSSSIPLGLNAGNYTVYYYSAESANYYRSNKYTIQCTIDKAVGEVTNTPTAKSLTFNGNAQALINAGSGTGTMLYSLDNNSWGVSIPTGTNAGTYTVYYKTAASENYTESPTGSIAITINKANISASVSMAGWTYGGTATNPSVSGNSGSGSVTYSYKVNGAADSTYTTTKPSNANTYVVRAVIAETTNYNGATVTNTFTIAKASPSYTAPTAKSLTYSGSAQALLNAGSTSHGTILYSSNNSSWSTTIPTGTNAGSYTSYWRLVGDSNHTDVSSTSIGTTIAQATGSASISGRTVTYSGSAQNLISVSGNTGTMHYKVDNGSWTTTIPTGTNVGSWTIYYYMDASTNYTGRGSSSSAWGNVTGKINKATQSAPTAKGATVTYGSTATATASGGGGLGSIEWSNGSTRTAVGSQSTSARWSGNSNYEPSPYSSAVTLQVNKATGSVSTAPTNKGVTYSGSAQTLANAGSGTGTMYYRLGTSGSFSTTIPTQTNVGSWTLYYYAAESTNYTLSATGSITVTIIKANQSAPTAKGATVTYGSTATATASGGGGLGSIEWSNGSTRTAVGSLNTLARWSGNSNYNASGWSSAVTLTVNKATGSVTKAPTNKGVTYNGSNQNLINAGSGTGTMYYRIGTSGNFSTSIPVASTAGSYTVLYYAAESTNYTQSSTGSVTATIAKANLNAPTATGATTTYNTTATASASGGGGLGSIEWSNGNTQTSVGSKNTLARWSGNTNYNASGWSNTVTLTMNKAAGSVTKAPTNRGVTYSGSNQNLVNAGSGTGTMYYRLGTSGSFSTSIPVASTAGSYTVYYYAAASTNYNQSGTGSVTATIGKANLNAPTASGSTVSYGSTATARASGGGGQGSIEWSNGSSRTAVGSQSTQARWSGNTNYNASGWSNTVTLTVNKAAGSVTTKPTAKSLTYSGSALALVNAGSGTGTMYYSLSSSSGFSTSIPTGTNAGTYTVYYYAAASTNYNLSSTGSVSVTIGKANSSISFKYSSYRYPFNGWYSMDHNPVTITKGNGSISYSSSNTSIASIVTKSGVLGVQCHTMGSCTIYATISATTNYNSATASFTQIVECTTENLGLPSGNLWATMNVGSSTVQGTGNYYMYGKGSRSYVKTDSAYTGTENPLSASADTARQVWGGTWRTPTKADWNELYANTTQTWTSVGGVYGKKFTSKKYNAAYIFIPAGGRYVSGTLSDYNTTGYYCTSTPSGSAKAYRATFNSTAQSTSDKSRTDGYLIRAVK